MNTQSKIDQIIQLKNELKVLESQVLAEQTNCVHAWSDAYYDPQEVMEPSEFKTVGMGSDVWSEPRKEAVAYRNVSKPRWSRICQRCRKIESTNKQKAVKMEADFS